MTRERIYLFDTTLRDGQQTPGVDFSLEDKLVVIGLLDEMGVDYIQGYYVERPHRIGEAGAVSAAVH